MKAIDALLSRISTKDFLGKQIPAAALNTVLACGMSAPVGMRRYDTLHLTVIQNAALLDEISENAHMRTEERPKAPLYGAPTLIVVSSRFERTDNIEYANVGCIMENMSVAATALGLGSVYLWGFIRTLNANEALLAKLNLPQGFVPISALALGYTKTETELKTKPSHNILTDFIK